MIACVQERWPSVAMNDPCPDDFFAPVDRFGHNTRAIGEAVRTFVLLDHPVAQPGTDRGGTYAV